MNQEDMQAFRTKYLEELRQPREVFIAITDDGGLRVSSGFQLSGWADITGPKPKKRALST